MGARFSFHQPLNTITPQKGLVVSAYFSDRVLGSGAKVFLMIGVTGRYVSLLHIPSLQVKRVRTCDWSMIPAEAVAIDGAQLQAELIRATTRHTLRGKRYSAHTIAQATAIIEEWLP